MEMDLETVKYIYRHFSWWSVGWREGEDLRRICQCYSNIAVKYNITVNMLINEQVMNDSAAPVMWENVWFSVM